MKFITDPDLINYRIALQKKLLDELNNFYVVMTDLRRKAQKGKLNVQDLSFLREQINIVANIHYELEFGNYFIKQSVEFRNSLINSLTKKYYSLIMDSSVDIRDHLTNQALSDMDEAIEEEINAERNAARSKQ